MVSVVTREERDASAAVNLISAPCWGSSSEVAVAQPAGSKLTARAIAVYFSLSNIGLFDNEWFAVDDLKEHRPLGCERCLIDGNF